MNQAILIRNFVRQGMDFFVDVMTIQLPNEISVETYGSKILKNRNFSDNFGFNSKKKCMAGTSVLFSREQFYQETRKINESTTAY